MILNKVSSHGEWWKCLLGKPMLWRRKRVANSSSESTIIYSQLGICKLRKLLYLEARNDKRTEMAQAFRETWTWVSEAMECYQQESQATNLSFRTIKTLVILYYTILYTMIIHFKKVKINLKLYISSEYKVKNICIKVVP